MSFKSEKHGNITGPTMRQNRSKTDRMEGRIIVLSKASREGKGYFIS